jgi:hypothetical protein
MNIPKLDFSKLKVDDPDHYFYEDSHQDNNQNTMAHPNNVAGIKKGANLHNYHQSKPSMNN